MSDELFRLRIPKPCDFITLNNSGTRSNRWAYQNMKRQWVDATIWALRSQLQHIDRPLPPAVLSWDFYFKTNRRRDPDNYVATRKPVLDTLIKEGRLWPDDNPDWVSNLEPSVSGRSITEGVIITARLKGTPDV
jgi:hypothetical protein